MGQRLVSDALYNRLQKLSLLEDEDRSILDRLLARVHDYPVGETVVEEGGPIARTRLILAGWAIRYRTLHDGSRQIVNFVLPGDSIGLYGALFPSSDSGVELVTDCRLAEFPCDELIATCRQSPRIGAALCWIGGQDERMLEQQILRIGAMNAATRISHLLVEIHHRLLLALQGREDVVRIPEQALWMPLTQQLVGEALGLSKVHVNRCCRRLVHEGLIEISRGGLRLLDPEGLDRFCGGERPSSTRASASPSLERGLDPET